MESLFSEIDQANELNPAGKKRPVLRGPSGRMTPVPWIGGVDVALGEKFSYIDSGRANKAENEKLCIVCGTHRGNDWVYGLLGGKPHDYVDHDPVSRIFGGSPSPTYGHPECILKAALYCPHLQNQEYPAMLQDRQTKLTVEDLKALVKDKKILKREGATSFAMGGSSIIAQRRRKTASVR